MNQHGTGFQFSSWGLWKSTTSFILFPTSSLRHSPRHSKRQKGPFCSFGGALVQLPFIVGYKSPVSETITMTSFSNFLFYFILFFSFGAEPFVSA